MVTRMWRRLSQNRPRAQMMIASGTPITDRVMCCAWSEVILPANQSHPAGTPTHIAKLPTAIRIHRNARPAGRRC